MLDRMINAEIDVELFRMGAMPLGKIISSLESIANKNIRCYVKFRGEMVGMKHPHSYRGFYRMLALEPDFDNIGTVDELLELLKWSNGHTFEGYKGGDYVMDEHSWVFIAQWGISSDLIVTGISESSNGVEIRIKEREGRY